MFVSVTRLELRSLWKLIPLISLSGKIIKQARQAKGNSFVAVSHQRLRFFYTMSSWDSKEDMQAFMRSGFHATAMTRSKELSKTILSRNFESEEVPEWGKVKKMLR